MKKKEHDTNLDRQSGYFQYDDVELFTTIYAGNNFKVPLKWFLNEIDIFYR